MKLDVYHIDAFADEIFQGNPAAVCILKDWLPDAIMQALASELNLSETAFSVPRGDGDFRIRWFTPTKEVALCGHATLATAHVLYNILGYDKTPIRFHSLSGPLITMPSDYGICMDFPVQPVKKISPSSVIDEALGCLAEEVYANEDLVVLLSDASEVTILEPNLNAIASLPYRGVCVAAPGNGNGYDFVCRFFAPASGINEDPVTGSAFTKLTPLYALRMGKSEFTARQVSKRGGDVQLSLQGDRLLISGRATTVMQSQLNLPGF